jgi:hypothetical protein
MKIIFGVLSSKDSAAAIQQFAQAVAPHIVLVHHDYSKYPDFDPQGPNIYRVDHYIHTKWGDWSLVEAALVLMRQAVGRFEFDYFQLVSESCLPIRPISEFEEHLKIHRPAVMINRLPIESGEALYNFGWRYFSSVNLYQRIMRRAGAMCLGKNRRFRSLMGVNLRISTVAEDGWLGRLNSLAGRLILRLLLCRPFSDFRRRVGSPCWVGSQWFGASHEAAVNILGGHEALPAMSRHYAQCPIPDESYFHTLIGAAVGGRVMGGNHHTSWASAGTGPDQLEIGDLWALRSSNLFFARKLSLNPDCALRLALLKDTAMASEAV